MRKRVNNKKENGCKSAEPLVDSTLQLSKTAEDLKNGGVNTRVVAAIEIRHSAEQEIKIAPYFSAMIKALEDDEPFVRTNSGWALEKAIENGENLNEYTTKFLELLKNEKARMHVVEILLKLDLTVKEAKQIMELTRTLDRTSVIQCNRLTAKAMEILKHKEAA